MSRISFSPTPCAICETLEGAAELYAPNFDLDAFNPEVFSARRLPDRIHYRMVKCKCCGLVRSDPVVDPETLAGLYSRSSFDYHEQVKDLRLTYGCYLSKLRQFGAGKDSLLEIGCGNGFFLEEALRQGYQKVAGIEPSSKAISQATPEIQEAIVCDIMRPGVFEEAQFDVICMFQVFDHVSEPATLLEECLRILKPGGVILVLNHNVEAFSARLLGERSPIVDIEHTYLYSPDTLRRILSKAGFQVLHTGPVFNHHRLYYLLRLLPLPNSAKQLFLKFLKVSRLGQIPLKLPLGNLYAVARKPAGSAS